MDAFYEKKYHLLEKEQWWFRARRDAILKLVKKVNRDARILDVGCSTGILLQELEKLGFTNLFGIDVSKKAVEASIHRGFANSFVMNGENPEFEAGSFDLIISSDSLEHMEFDNKALENWFKLLKSNGSLIVFVPAFMFLWSNHDVVNQHYRRYTRKILEQKVVQKGFTLKASGYWNFALFFPVALQRLTKKILGIGGEWDNDLDQTPKIINKILYTILKLENSLYDKNLFPVGVSTFCIAEKTK